MRSSAAIDTAVRAAINQILEEYPGIREERISVGGGGGLAERLAGHGLLVSASSLRRHLRAMNLRTSGKGAVAGGLLSRERLDERIRQAVTSRSDWKATGVQIRGRNGLAALLAKEGIHVNHEVLRKRISASGTKLRPRNS